MACLYELKEASVATLKSEKVDFNHQKDNNLNLCVSTNTVSKP